MLYEKAYQEEKENIRGEKNCVIFNQVSITVVLSLIIIFILDIAFIGNPAEISLLSGQSYIVNPCLQKKYKQFQHVPF